jgi:hypothetical protein
MSTTKFIWAMVVVLLVLATMTMARTIHHKNDDVAYMDKRLFSAREVAEILFNIRHSVRLPPFDT